MIQISSTDPAILHLAPLPIDADLLCGHCHQNLRGVSSDRCPECGQRFDRAHVLQFVIPWEQRKQIGRFRAYWRTVRIFTFRGSAAAEEAEITLSAALSFKCVTVLFVWLTAAVLMQCGKSAMRPNSARQQSLLYFQSLDFTDLADLFRNSYFFAVSLVALCVFIISATAIPGWFYYQRHQTNAQKRRAAAVCCYGIAPLAWMPVLTALALLFLGLEISYEHLPLIFYAAAAVFGTFGVLCGLCPVVYAWSTLGSIRKVTGSRSKAIAAAILLPILWPALAGVIFFWMQFAVNYLAFIYVSLRQ